MKKVKLIILFILIFNISCFAQENTRMEILKQKIDLIIRTYHIDRHYINIYQLDNIIKALEKIFSMENDYIFRNYLHNMNNAENDRIYVFRNNNLIVRITFYFDFLQNNDNEFEFVYASISLNDDEIQEDIMIMNDGNSNDINELNIRFTHSYHDVENEYFYYNIYRIIGNEAYIVNKFCKTQQHYFPLIETTIIYRWNNEN